MTATATDIARKRAAFRALHREGCFVLPNPWDIGSALYLQSLGFKALATTSSGHAWSRGWPDNGITLEMALAHLREMASATHVPINADFEGGFGDAPSVVEAHVRLAVDTGVAGLSIEDSRRDPADPLYPIHDAQQRVAAARSAIDRTGADVVLVGRAECFLVGRPDLDETIARLRAYAEAGADCLYAPGLTTPEQIRAVVQAVAPRPVNVLVGGPAGLSVGDLAALGVRRVSVGGALARVAWGAFMTAATQLAQDGSFAGLAHAASGNALNALFQRDGAHDDQ